MWNFRNHPANRRSIFKLAYRIQLVEAQPLYDQLLIDVESDSAAVVLNLDFLSSGLFLSCHNNYPRISSSDFSRRRATSCGSFKLRSPSNVALITLCGFEVPIDFVRMFETPAACMTARTAPPAMIPVPSTAGFSSTRPAPNNPITW